jgi:hypothetical protein
MLIIGQLDINSIQLIAVSRSSFQKTEKNYVITMHATKSIWQRRVKLVASKCLVYYFPESANILCVKSVGLLALCLKISYDEGKIDQELQLGVILETGGRQYILPS